MLDGGGSTKFFAVFSGTLNLECLTLQNGYDVSGLSLRAIWTSLSGTRVMVAALVLQGYVSRAAVPRLLSARDIDESVARRVALFSSTEELCPSPLPTLTAIRTATTFTTTAEP